MPGIVKRAGVISGGLQANNELLKAGIRWNACFLVFNNPKADVIKAEILPGRGKGYGSKRSGKAKEKETER